MTINIAIAVAEGIVMAADSVSQMQIANQVLGTHMSVEKLTEIRGVPMAAMSNGLGAIANRTLLSLIREFEFAEYGKDGGQALRALTVEQMANALADVVNARYAAEFTAGITPMLGILVGGYSPGEFFPELFNVTFPGRGVTRLHPQPNMPPGSGTINWAGIPMAVRRIVSGVDLDTLIRARDLVNQAAQPGFVAPPGSPPLPTPTAADPVATIMPYMQLLQMPHTLDGMPLEEAAEFARFLGMVAIGYDRFTVGPPAVGGELDVLAIQPEGLSWYQRKRFATQMAEARREFDRS